MPEIDVTTPLAAVRPEHVNAVVHQVRLYDRVIGLVREQFDATLAHSDARIKYDAAIFDAHARQVATHAQFITAMARVYRDPVEAVRRFEADAQIRSTSTAVTTLMSTPETYGTLRMTDRSGLAALFRDRDDMPARVAAHDAAIHAITTQQRRIEMIEVPKETAVLREAMFRVDAASAQLSSLPTGARIERDLRSITRDITPDEHRAIAAMLTDAQRSLMQSMGVVVQNIVRQTARDIALGQDGRER